MGIKKDKKPQPWHTLPPPYQVGKRGFKYSDVKTDYDGWVDAKIYRSAPFDLVRMKTQDKTKSGWWTGVKWDGYKFEKSDDILYWKIQK